MIDKLAACLDLLSRNNIVSVTIVPSTRGTLLPRWLRDQRELLLDIGHSMPKPIPDLRVTETGVIATLSFGGVPCLCAWSWDAVVQMHGETSGYHSYRANQPANAVVVMDTVPLLNFTAAAKVREPFVPRVILGGKNGK